MSIPKTHVCATCEKNPCLCEKPQPNKSAMCGQPEREEENERAKSFAEKFKASGGASAEQLVLDIMDYVADLGGYGLKSYLTKKLTAYGNQRAASVIEDILSRASKKKTFWEREVITPKQLKSVIAQLRGEEGACSDT